MSEVASRPSASCGRSSGRRNRGGFAVRGGRRSNGDRSDHKSGEDNLGASDDQGDFAELRKKFGDKTSVIREMFPDWSEADVLFALQETNGDQNEAVARIADGTVSQWGEVSKPKKTARAKAAKDTSHALALSDVPATGPRNTRGGRTLSESGRGRGRGSERGGRGGRGRSAHAGVNGTRAKENLSLSVPTEESSAWDNEKPKTESPEFKPAVTAAEKSAIHAASNPASSQAKTWASMLRQSTAPKVVSASMEPLAPKPIEPVEPLLAAEASYQESEDTEPVGEPTPVPSNAVPAQIPIVTEPETSLPPAADELTETNLERAVDTSNPPATGTAASTAADSWDPRQGHVSATTTPISAAQHQHQAQRPTTNSYAASAMKANAERVARAPSYQRRVLDQEEAVRMPGNREVDRAAVQFGAFNLYGGDDDIDGDREDPETRAQPPADSPVTHPRASLPPVSQPVVVPEAFAQKPAAAGTAGVVQVTASTHSQVPNTPQSARYGHGGGVQDAAATSQKPTESFNQQNTSASQPPFESYSSQSSQPQAQQPGGGSFSSGPSEYSNYYTANQPERNPYNFYGGQQYGSQQGAHGQHDNVPSQQRLFGGYSAQNDSLVQYPQSGAMHAQPRFGGSSESQNSGHSTPNPTVQGQHQAQQAQQAQHVQPAQPAQQPQAQQPQQQGAPGTQPQTQGQQFPNYSHQYYNSNPYYHQYHTSYGQGGFGPYGKGGMYGQPYGVSPNAPYDHASSSATFGPSSLHRDSGLGSGLGDYGRMASGQVGNQPGLGGSGFGGSHDSFTRGASSFQSQGQSFNSQTQPQASGPADELKPFGDAKTGSGPSPSLGGGPRPGSAANNTADGQSGLPPPQTSQMGGAYGGYPSHLHGHGLHGGSAYGMGAGAGSSQHGSTPYGSYGQNFGSGGYYGGGQQQRSGWGVNYH